MGETQERRVSRDLKQFLQFVAATIILAWLGGQIARAGLPGEYALPFFVLWIIVFLATVGFIIAGKEGMIELLRSVGLFWVAIFCATIPVILASLIFIY